MPFLCTGQLNQSIAEMENALDPVSEEEHLRAIWKDLGVGTDGYLTLNELATVCDHIGMDEMNPEVRWPVFSSIINSQLFHCREGRFLLNGNQESCKHLLCNCTRGNASWLGTLMSSGEVVLNEGTNRC